MVRSRYWLFLTQVLISIILISCYGPGGDPTPTNVFPISIIQAEAYGLPIFYDDFEDNNLNENERWFNGTRSREYIWKRIIDSGHDNKFLILHGPVTEFSGETHNSGLYSNLFHNYPDPFQPTYIGFNIFAWPSLGMNMGFFVIQGRYPESPSQVQNLINFHYRADGEFFMNGVSYGPWDSEWHLVEFRNITWEGPVPLFNFYIDGNLLGECIEFQEPIHSPEKIQLYNLDEGYAGYDNIIMSEINPSPDEPSCTGDPSPPPPPPAPPNSQGGSPDGFIATAKQDAACRQGPANEYPEADYVDEGFSAPVIGRNQNSNWFVVTGPNWGEDCWIWEGVLETTGDINPVPILPDPVLVLPGEDNQGSKKVCKPDLDQQACEKNGGTWMGAAAADPCKCP